MWCITRSESQSRSFSPPCLLKLLDTDQLLADRAVDGRGACRRREKGSQLVLGKAREAIRCSIRPSSIRDSVHIASGRAAAIVSPCAVYEELSAAKWADAPDERQTGGVSVEQVQRAFIANLGFIQISEYRPSRWPPPETYREMKRISSRVLPGSVTDAISARRPRAPSPSSRPPRHGQPC